jgi:methionine sulfoxide reductase heme-binding subunit
MAVLDSFNGAARRLPTWVIYVCGAIPFAALVYGAIFGGLGADPVKALENELGQWGLRFLVASLAITPLMRLGLRLLKFRRAVGLVGFSYIVLHFLVWITLDLALRWGQIGSELYKRPFILVGFAAFLMLLPLALTSWNGAVRRMGALAWKRLHRLAYPAILAGAVHYVMIGKVWSYDALFYLALTLVLLATRLPFFARQRV